MSIYTPKTITERIERRFKPTRLAVKECNGIKYLCKSTGKNFEKYKGSGVYWKNIVKKYGKKNVKTLWVSDANFSKYHGDNCKVVKAKPIISCEHCRTGVTNKTNYIRYHGDKCKSKIGQVVLIDTIT